MGNGRTRNINYKPRYTQMEAFDMLPKPIREVLWEGAQKWDCNWILRQYKKYEKEGGIEYAIKRSVERINRSHQKEIEEGKCWRERRVGQRWDDVPKSPHVQAEATMQTSGYNRGAA